jgi:S-adenosylmethionine:tRNA ribosyltransferase-isomerase
MSSPDLFSVEAYDYVLPERLIAQRPAHPRDSSRLLVIDRARGSWEHRSFTDLPGYFGAEDVLVANNTRVIKARLLGRRLKPPIDGSSEWTSGGSTEFVMLEQLGPRTWEGLFKASARYVAGLRFQVPTPDGKGIVGTLVRGSAESASGTVVAEFDRDPVESDAGELPLPHYIRRDPATAASDGAPDAHDYQTLYAKKAGSAAAPTAGLHFTSHVMEALRSRGASWEEVTLDVGLGTFRPVKTADIRGHVMHGERYEISVETASRLNEAKRSGRRVTAVGTTSVRTLESAWREGGGMLKAGSGRTSIFVYPGAPGYEKTGSFGVVDRLLTNFHLPKSTLLMLVSAFAGRELVLAAYEEAVREEYRFFSYGDAMLVI